MEKEKLENILNDLLSTGADFAEIFLERKKAKTFNFIDKRLDQLSINTSNGIGLRIAKENLIYYGSTSNLDESEIKKVVNGLKNNLQGERLLNDIKLKDLESYHHQSKDTYSNRELKALFKELDEKIRSKDKRITQVSINLQSVNQDVEIANQTGIHVTENRIRTRIFITVYFKDGELTSNVHFSKGMALGNEFLKTIDFDKEIDELIQMGIDKLYAKPCIGKVMPVVIGPGFGGVIFHEACGHAMEATSVADHLSVLSDDLNKQIASSKVTIIDDGTLDGEWGSTKIDDEGRKTQKNILIENGVLKSYLIDEINNRKMKMKPTASGRRQNYTFAPTSRMNNTYLAPGNDSIEDMIKSIDLGLYAKEMGGGCVSTETGDFNFACNVAYMIRDGKIAECVKSASLIGNTKEILQSIEMVGNNLELGQGMCGSISGSVPVNVGEPTIKVKAILVGGEKNEE